ncbi:MAG TPA: S24 family peptidase [Candidatus Woesebacteria bacterium]|nr:S24 family peptidase [Candidatus Woesebacteria bacterium]
MHDAANFTNGAEIKYATYNDLADGDIVVIKHQQTADDGDTIVAITENGATLKRYRSYNGKIYLEPRNQKLQNIYPKSLEVRGKFVGLIRTN